MPNVQPYGVMCGWTARLLAASWGLAGSGELNGEVAEKGVQHAGWLVEERVASELGRWGGRGAARAEARADCNRDECDAQATRELRSREGRVCKGHMPRIDPHLAKRT